MSMAAPIQVVGVGGSGNLTGATQVAAGRYHTCALVSGSVYCWGSNQNGQLGANSNVTQSNTPLQVVSVSGAGTLNNVTSIAAGAYHTCALAGGIIYCWGANSGGQLGNGSIQDSSYPVGVMNSGYVTLTGVISISAGYRHSCAISSINEVVCWGAGSYGQLGENTTADQSVATNVVGVGGVGNLTAGVIANGSSGNHMCSISTDQANVYCWGLGSSGQIGNNTTPATQLLPVPVTVTSQPYLMVK
jgi:alpha-tubulin suppressor-like RCC1 family protein